MKKEFSSTHKFQPPISHPRQNKTSNNKVHEFDMDSNQKGFQFTKTHRCAICGCIVVAVMVVIYSAISVSKSVISPVDLSRLAVHHELKKCYFSVNVSKPIQAVLCAVDQKRWFIGQDYQIRFANKCLIGAREAVCKPSLRTPIPAKKDIRPESSITVAAQKNNQYNKLGMIAESLVPKIWWREGFRSGKLLLGKRDGTDLFINLLNDKIDYMKWFEFFYICTTSFDFMKAPITFTYGPVPNDSKVVNDDQCSSNIPVFQEFWTLWSKEGIFFEVEGNNNKIHRRLRDNTNKNDLKKDVSQIVSKKLRASAETVMQYYMKLFGATKQTCSEIKKSEHCRGVIAAALQILTIHNLANISNKDWKIESQSTFANDVLHGYMMAAMGRALLHADTSSSGDTPVSVFHVKAVDYVAIQSAYLQLYVESMGEVYSRQLDGHVPFAFPPQFEVTTRPDWKHLSFDLEPMSAVLRNWMYSVEGNLVDYGPYRALVSLPGVPATVLATRKQRVLIDVGADSFFASPKYLLDSYAAYLPFTHLYIIEPDSNIVASIPAAYSSRYDIKHLNIFAEVGTASNADLVKMLPTLVTKDDFVVLKFDVDPNHLQQGATLEWGFLFSLMQTPDAAVLIDELYISLHFHFPFFGWNHYHSNWEALDCIRHLRAHGMIVHAWE